MRCSLTPSPGDAVRPVYKGMSHARAFSPPGGSEVRTEPYSPPLVGVRDRGADREGEPASER